MYGACFSALEAKRTQKAFEKESRREEGERAPHTHRQKLFWAVQEREREIRMPSKTTLQTKRE